MQPKTLAQLASLVQGKVHGDGQVVVSGAATIETARQGDITLADGSQAIGRLTDCVATAAVVRLGDNLPLMPAIAVADVHAAFAQIVQQFRPSRATPDHHVHPQAHVSESAKLGDNVHIGWGSYIGDRVEIGDNCWIGPQVTILDDAKIGQDSQVFPQAVLYQGTVVGPRCIIHAGAVLGAYGFGYRTIDGQHQLSAQLGWVELEADVEIGAVSTVDRGTYGPTQVGQGTKVDNHVMIAHNCRIGRHNLLCSQVGIAGSSTTGDYVVMAGQVGVPDHVRIGHRAILGAKAGILRDVPDGMTVLGIPATPERHQMQIQAHIARLPEMRKELRELRRTVDRIAPVSEVDRPQRDAA